MSGCLFKERKFFQLEFLKDTVRMIDAGCKFRIVHYPTLDLIVMFHKDEALCAQSFIFYNNG